MLDFKIQIIESIVLVILLIVVSKVLKNLISKVGLKHAYHETRIVIVKKVITFTLYLILIGTLLLIWGIPPTKLAGYVASLFTVLGIAFIAQWSILSNITSTLIVFFNHQVNIGDTIVILDKDYNIDGVISDIGIFFIIIKISDTEYVSLPSNVFMQKMIKKVKEA